jgi:hypothetical protein
MLYGILVAFRRQLSTAPLVFFLLLIPSVYYITHAGLTRYRYPIEPIIIIFAGFGFYLLVVLVKRRIIHRRNSAEFPVAI